MAIVEIRGWRTGFNKVACTRLVRAATGLDLEDGKRITDGVLTGRVQRISVPSDNIAQRLLRDLAEIGATVKVIAG